MHPSTDEYDSHLFPFDEGDIVVRSCDDQDFMMYKLDLSRASPVFRNMWSLPQPTKNLLDGTSSKYGLAVVKLAESAEVLTILLALCTPMHDANKSFRDIADAARILEAARKYEMAWVIEQAWKAMRKLAQDEPIRAYAAACRLGLKEEIVHAAKMCLRVPIETILACEAEELEQITSTQLRRLVKYRSDCSKAVEDTLQMLRGDSHGM
ncbi:hypothetical protein PHLGIDRAFT_130854 [Phlebiopsis gigantea 11061_1 CR5-6]|uniref:BTB domain-containing protein n=1 Tax=Phlebiopsis gigantea (strain 11061_1 CR5-6) TaxID=745531 RepID=A0A0C3PBC2_PHLG1|nr:hypothetical protein PHLGIDRAFT_130854 [Phlebiopsis gigantea 11061_1 CR5-6]